MNDLKEFGRLVREKRAIARLSQEAVAASAFGNPSRKGYISAIENGRKKGIQPQTVQRLADVLGIPRHEVPESLRWPVVRDQDRLGIGASTADPIEQYEKLRSLVGFIEEMERSTRLRLSRSPVEAYRQNLSSTLDRLTAFWGESFSGRSFALSLTVAYLYIFFAGVLAYAHDGGALGELHVFQKPDWAASLLQPQLAAGIAAIVLLTCIFGFRLAGHHEVDEPPNKHFSFPYDLLLKRRVKVVVGGGLLGCSAVIVSQMGVDPVVASIVVVIFGLMALSDLGPVRSGGLGAVAGFVAGLIENLATHKSLLGGLEGALFGFVLGGASFYFGTMVANRIAIRVVGAASGAGVGICIGAIITMGFFTLSALLFPSECLSPCSEQRLFDPLAPQDKTFVVLAVIWVLLPTVNAIQDYLSYGISRTLAYKFLNREPGMAQAFHFTLLDIAIALILALMTLASVFGALWAANQLFELDLAPREFFSVWWQEPLSEGLWLSLMILSTLSWSILHYACIVLPTASAHFVSGKFFENVRCAVHQSNALRRFSLQTYAVSFVPSVLFVFAYLVALVLSFGIALWGIRLVA